MSLINDVLRDLDARRRRPPAGSAPVEGFGGGAHGGRRRGLPVLLAALVTLALGVWLGQSFTPGPTPLRPASPAPVAAAPRAPAPVAAAPRAPAPIPSPSPRAERAAPGQDGPALAALAATPTPAEPEAPVREPEPEPPARRADARRAAPPAAPRRAAPLARAETLHREALRVAERYPAAARDLLLEALELTPRHRASREALATLLAREGQPAAALAVLATGRRHDPTHVGYLEIEARVRAAHGEVEPAIAVLEDALALRRDADLLGLLAALERRRGRADRAATHYRAALRLDPARAPFWLGLAIAEESLGDPQAALVAYRRALRAGLAPTSRAWARERARALGR